MGITRTYHAPYYSGATGTVSPAGTTPFHVVLNGRGYLVDLAFNDPYTFKSEPLLAAAFLQDRGTTPIGEHSLNSRDYWRRSVDDWSAGAGQFDLDHPTSIANRYRTSKGIDPWTSGQISMLPDTAKKVTSANTNLAMVVAGSYLYLLDGTALKRTQDITVTTPTMTAVTANGADATLSSAVSMTSDGYTVWIADGTRVHYTTRGGADYNKFHTSDEVAYLIRSVKGRLFSATGVKIRKHTLTAGSAVASDYFAHPNSDWAWTDFAGGPACVYFAGFSGDKSAIYAATIKADGTDLDAPIVFATLPTGEIVRSLTTYLSVMIIGTDKGFRIASIAQDGSLILGGLVSLANAPKCFEAQDRFVWYGWSNYDTTSTGLGRIDLGTFNQVSNAELPAYASDLMATAQGAVTSVVTFQGIRAFTVSGSGMWVQTTNKVASATITSGWLNYALADPKVAIKLNVQYRVGAGYIDAQVAGDDKPTVSAGSQIVTSTVAGNSASLAVPQIVARNYEVTLTLTRSATDQTAGPSVDRMTLMVEPQPERRAQFSVPLLFHSEMQNRNGATITFKPAEERRRIYELMQSRQVVPFQDFEATYSVIVDDFAWVPYQLVGNQRSWDGTLQVNLKVIG